MAKPRPIRLRETPDRGPQSAQVIDVPFKVVRQRRSRLLSFGKWVLAFAAAAAIGFLIPPLWVTVEQIFAPPN